ncbi:MAG: alkaline phosphatase family protein [Candidatus Acidiferrales bacterium]
MSARGLVLAGAVVAMALASWTPGTAADSSALGSGKIKHVLLLSIDGMHAVDFYNCSHGIAGVNSGNPYCPNMAALSQTAINYVGTTSSKPSDSFPGLAALVTGGSPKSTGLYYDVAYDRSLDPPTMTTGTGLAGGSCTPYALPTGTTTDYDQGIEIDDTKLNGGAPGAAPTEGGIASIDPRKLVRDPQTGCAPVYPWNFVRTNTIFSVVHASGGYTAWIDKHASYSFTAGPGGAGLNDYYSPEVDSGVIALPGVTTSEGVSCATIRDTSSAGSVWSASFENIQCYDALKVKALLNEIAGKTHTGAAAKIPALFGMNFQSVYIGESVVEPGVGTGGYNNAAAEPSDELVKEIEFVDASVGDIIQALMDAGIYNDTLIVITAKHGESPIDTSQYVADGTDTPATLLGPAIPFSESPLNTTGIGATEDDVSVLWLKEGESVTAAVNLLDKNAAAIGLGEIYYGPTLALNYGVGGLNPGEDPRSPDIIVTPNVGVTYSGSTTMIGDHGGFAHDDTNVVMLVANPSFTAQTVFAGVTTMQVAPTILQALGLSPTALDAVKTEGTPVLPEVAAQLAK